MRVHIRAFIITGMIMVFNMLVCPSIATAATLERGYPAVGGEYLLIGIIIWFSMHVIYRQFEYTAMSNYVKGKTDTAKKSAEQ